MKKNKLPVSGQKILEKSPTGIFGFDEITNGGLPKGRPSLVCGAAGCGKTLFSMEFLVMGATKFNEPGVFIAFEESEKELSTNVASLGFNLEELIKKKMLILDHVHIERSEIEETGEYDLEGLFIRLNYAIDSIGAKRVVLDTLESLFSGLPNPLILRAELRRLFRWLKDKGVTAIITGERGTQSLTREGLEEYVSDCVILLDHRVSGEVSTRRLRVVKYRGSVHGTNEYPFLIDEDGFSVLPVTSLGLDHKVSTERISSGIPDLDEMLGGKGYYKGSSILASGTAGTGKSSLAAHLVKANCEKGHKVLYFAFEESPDQILRNMKSIGIDLNSYLKNGLLSFEAQRPLQGIEMHLTLMIKKIRQFSPDIVVIDPINSFVTGSSPLEARSMAIRLIDFLKSGGITGFFTSLTTGSAELEHTNILISSLIDTWLFLRDIELDGERNRGIYILKSRGMAHSNQIREFLITSKGLQLREVYLGLNGVLTGSARIAQEAREKAFEEEKRNEISRKKMDLERKRKIMETQVEALKAQFEAEEAEAMKLIQIESEKAKIQVTDHRTMAKSRKG